MAIVELTPTEQPTGTDLIQTQPAAAYLASLKTKVSRAGQESALNTVAEVVTGLRDWRQMDWSTLTAANVVAVMAKLNDYAPATRKKTLAAMKGVALAAWRLNIMDSETHARIRDIREKRGSRLPAGRYLDVGEVELLLRACANDKAPAGARDAAMIALARSAGLRREEIVSLTLDNYDHATGIIRLIGKGDKERLAYVKNGAQRYMDKWLRRRGTEPGALFCAINKGGHLEVAQMITTTAAHFILGKRAEQAGVQNVTWHDFRRSWISDLWDKGVDGATIAELAGHSSVDTTKAYDRRSERTREQAAGYISVPYFE